MIEQGDCVFITDRKDANYLKVGYIQKKISGDWNEPPEYQVAFVDDNSVWIYKSELHDKCKILMCKEETK